MSYVTEKNEAVEEQYMLASEADAKNAKVHADAADKPEDIAEEEKERSK